MFYSLQCLLSRERILICTEYIGVKNSQSSLEEPHIQHLVGMGSTVEHQDAIGQLHTRSAMQRSLPPTYNHACSCAGYLILHCQTTSLPNFCS
jgi:hypothetical protein